MHPRRSVRKDSCSEPYSIFLDARHTCFKVFTRGFFEVSPWPEYWPDYTATNFEPTEDIVILAITIY
jgi:hypothetical protein